MVGKQLERLVSDNKKGSSNKSFICYVDNRELKFLVFKCCGVYIINSKGEIEKLKSLTDTEGIFLSIDNCDVKVIGSGNIGI